MHTIHLNSAFGSNSLEEIKLLSLYYDNVIVDEDSLYSIDWNDEKEEPYIKKHGLLPHDFSVQYELLIKEGILKINPKDDSLEFAKEIRDALKCSFDRIFPRDNASKDRLISREVFSILNDVRQIDITKDGVDVDFIFMYYETKLRRSIQQLMKGETSFTSSENLAELINTFSKNNEGILKGKVLPNNSLNLNLPLKALSLSLPNPQNLSFDDILSLKISLKDELRAFQYEMCLIQQETFQVSDHYTEPQMEALFYKKIEKPLGDLKAKCSGLKNRSLRNFIKNLQNPMAYAPLIATVIGSLPFHYSAALSLGLVSVDQILEYINEQKELDRNGLSFLLKISQSP